MAVRILTGDVRARLRTMEAESVHCIVTSPPYWGLRDYHADGQIGQEPSPLAWAAVMVKVFREIRRVLRKDGMVWLNVGDKYAGSGCGGDTGYSGLEGSTETQEQSKLKPTRRPDETGATQRLATTANVGRRATRGSAFRDKQRLMLPARMALALQDDGWWIRDEIIWHKPNPMPSSTTDRTTPAHEMLYLLTRSPVYFFDAVAIAEAASYDPQDTKLPDGWDTGDGAHGAVHRAGREKGRRSGNKARVEAEERSSPNSHVAASVPWEGLTRNKRSVWSIATEPFTAAPFFGAGSDGSGRIVSPDCPLHGDQRQRVSTARHGGRQAAAPREEPHNPRSDSDLGAAPAAAHAPIAPPPAGGSSPESLGLPHRACAGSATPHSSGNCRTAHALEISPRETVVEKSPCRTGGNGLSLGRDAICARTPTSNSGEGVAGDETVPDPSGRKQQSSARKCTCRTIDHFATFPTKLVEPCILAGTSQRGACTGCGAPWRRVVRPTFVRQPDVNPDAGVRGAGRQKPLDESDGRDGFPRGLTDNQTLGWYPSCDCLFLLDLPKLPRRAKGETQQAWRERRPAALSAWEAEAQPLIDLARTFPTKPCTVLDPFLGAGTTALVADRLGRNAVGIELNPDFVEMARRRITADAPLVTQVEISLPPKSRRARTAGHAGPRSPAPAS